MRVLVLALIAFAAVLLIAAAAVAGEVITMEAP